MRHEKIFKREDGSRVKIEVEIYVPFNYFHSDGHKWSSIVAYCAPGKRKFLPGYGRHTPDEILEVKLELWNKLKPE